MTDQPAHLVRFRQAAKAPVPESVSPEARRSLAAGVERLGGLDPLRPAPRDAATWKAEIAMVDALSDGRVTVRGWAGDYRVSIQDSTAAFALGPDSSRAEVTVTP